MRTYSGYEKVTVGDIPQKKLEKAIKSGKLSLTANDLKGNRVMLLHPLNAKKVKLAQSKNKGVTGMGITGGEILADVEWHDKAGGSMNGGSLWSWLKRAGKSVYNFAKNNWDILKPVVSKIADTAIPAIASAVGAPQASTVGREALRQLTGVGVNDRMAKARQAKKSKKINIMTASQVGGSFKLN